MVQSDGKNVVPEVWEVLDKIKGFSEKVSTMQGKEALLCSCLSQKCHSAGATGPGMYEQAPPQLSVEELQRHCTVDSVYSRST